jgi:hypothetical protein
MRRVPLSVVVVLVLGVVSAWAQSDPAVGTWKLNPAKSKFDPGPAPRSQTVVIAASGSGYKVNSTGVDGEGKPTSVSYAAEADGKDMPVTGSPSYDQTALKRIDKNTSEQTRKKGGKVVQTARRAISADGKTMTITVTGTDEKGRKVNNVSVFEKQ